MSEFENVPNINDTESISSEIQTEFNAVEKFEGGPVSGEFGEQELSLQEQLKNLESEIWLQHQDMMNLTELIEQTKAKINEVREKLGLQPTNEEPPSTSLERDKLEKLKAEQEGLEQQKGELTAQRELLIRHEKENILQDKLDELFKEISELNSQDFQSIVKTGRTIEGRIFESKSIGPIDPEAVQSLAKAFQEGIRLLPRILEILPGLLKKFDEDLTQEATERVDKQFEKLKMETAEESKPKGKLGMPEVEIPSGEKLGTSSVEGVGIETPEV